MTYPLWTLSVADMISDNSAPSEIENLLTFQTIMRLGNSTIESVYIKTIDLDDTENGVVFPMVSMDVVVVGETFHITVSMKADELIHFVNCDSQELSKFFS